MREVPPGKSVWQRKTTTSKPNAGKNSLTSVTRHQWHDKVAFYSLKSGCSIFSFSTSMGLI